MPQGESYAATDEERDVATEAVCDLLAFAEEASLRGQHAYAAYLMYRAERTALRTGELSLVSLVWRHAPLGRSVLA